MKRKIVLIIVSVLIIACLLAGCASKQKAEEYKSNLSSTVGYMLAGAISAEEAATKIHDVWYNCIYEVEDSTTNKYTRYKSSPGFYKFYDDFNDALNLLFEDSSFKDKISDIKSNQETVLQLMKDLNSPPKDYEEAFTALKDLYDAYLTITGLATSPSGNLQTFTSNYNNAESEFINKYNAMKIYLD